MALFTRHPANPIIVPGGLPWRRAVTFNPGVCLTEDGRTLLWERTAGSLRPFCCQIGLQESTDGVHFRQVGDQPVLTPGQLGSEHGSVQDPRVVRIDGRYLMTYAYRPFAWSSHPTAVGVPESQQSVFPGITVDEATNQTRSGIAESADGITWRHLAWVNSADVDERNVILFPERIDGHYVALRRPSGTVTTNARHDGTPGVQISWSQDLITWSPCRMLLPPAFAWESNRLGGSTPPIRTAAGWLVFYHGVETTDAAVRAVTYRMGAALLDLRDPTRVLARCPDPLLEPDMYYERVGAYIPNVVFPTGATVVGDELRLYYGCCDTAIALATASLTAVVERVLRHEL
jgi:beta-1,2-mannobiose phosphorylase / 1,2-beta-oligomannan phosphorylase